MYKSINLISGFLGLFFMAIIVFLFFYAAILILPFILLFFALSALINFFNKKDETIVQSTVQKKVSRKDDAIIDAEFEVIDDK